MQGDDPRIEDAPLRVDASPTKAFFVYIITKDIPLDKAIEDLVDNSIDGAKRIRPGNDADYQAPRYDGLWININVSREGFHISDNCGGILINDARHYAFKFGRPEGATETPFSVGLFGVGMKRALFKMGKSFSVKSIEPAASFDIDVNVTNWAREADWDFRMSRLDETPQSPDTLGTIVSVTNLYDAVASTFGLEYFSTKLKNSIRTVQQHFLRNGLRIVFNGDPIIPNIWQLKSGQGIEPYFSRFSDELGGNHPLKTRIYAGVGDSSPGYAGWYIFCNGRCILDADQSAITGWGETGEEGVTNPKAHNQFARFRGYAFLDCEEARLLPWNTTKTALDLESEAYRRLKGRLIDAMRTVIDFLNELDTEKNYEEPDKTLTRAVTMAASTPLESLPERRVFAYRPPPARGPALAAISYKRPADQAARLKDVMNASNNRELGEMTFEYAYSNLVEDV